MCRVQQEGEQGPTILLPHIGQSKFFERDRPDFSKPRVQRAARRELMTEGVGGRTSLAQRGAASIRAKFHNVPVELPPPPNAPTHVTEHEY